MPLVSHSLCRVICAVSFLSVCLLSHSQRLSQAVRPEHYTLTLTPNLKDATFTGSEKIDVSLNQSLESITLNAIEIKFKSVTARVNGKTLKATVTEDAQKEQATFAFGRPLPAGHITLSIEYSGILNNELRGFYLSKTEKRNYAVSQFEPTDARRAFPSFDEPAFKATFDVSLVIDKGDTAISNTNIVSDTSGPASGKHTVRFATTPKMSTYLVAFLVGDFQCTSGSSDGVPIRACATPDKVEYTRFAVSAAEFALHYYNNYFGIKYPMPKLDMIAIPDFEAGAMENFGAITYRETDLLLNDKNAAVGARKLVAAVVAHEMAHQWFGDMVTMQWWNNLWLNEGFATWMENKPVAAWHPEWKISEDVANDQNNTLNLDARRVTRTIRANADTPDEINEMFDGITYGKAGAVLLMVENYLGEETFRQGVHNYLSAHMYGNATAEDFWNAQTEVSHKPVDKIMESFVALPGEPVLDFSEAHDGSIPVRQQRFFLSPSAKADTQQAWSVPVCFKTSEKSKTCDVLSEAQQTLKASDAPMSFGNAGGAGYYRYTYPADAYAKIVDGIEANLTPTERISFIGNEWALVVANKASVGAYLNLAAAIKDDNSAQVVNTALDGVASAYNRVANTREERDAISAWIRKTFKPAYERLGAPSPEDAPDKRELRAILFRALGLVGKDPDVIAQAKQVAEQYLSNPVSVEATFAQTAEGIAAANGDAAYFDQLQKAFESAQNPEIQEGALRLLASFSNPTLEKRALDYAVSGKVRNQDSPHQLVAALRQRETQDFAWQYIQQNWDKVQAQMTTWGGESLVGGTSGFCSVEKRDEIASFFAAHKVHASARALQRAKDAINDCVELRSTQESNLKEWIAAQK